MPKCSQCNKDIIHVRDNFTGATFPVDAEPVATRGFILHAPGDGERNQRAELRNVEVYQPHNLSCEQLEIEEGRDDG